jgi:hypothetical protein
MLPEMDAYGDGKILGEGRVADQTNSVPLFPYDQLAGRGVRHCGMHCFRRRQGGGAFFPHRGHQHDVHIIVILKVINIFFSSLTT